MKALSSFESLVLENSPYASTAVFDEYKSNLLDDDSLWDLDSGLVSMLFYLDHTGRGSG